MRVLLAGATGTLGRPLVRAMKAAGHEVIGIARSASGEQMLDALGAEHVRADVMQRETLLNAVSGVRADAVVHELTALKKLPTAHRHMRETNLLRTHGTSNLLDAARVVGATRFVTQSIIFGYGYVDHGPNWITEDTDFGSLHGDKFDEHIQAMLSTERQTLSTEGIDGVALRYGLFYGADVSKLFGMLRKRMVPVPAGTSSTLGFIHHEDAASATVAALERAPGGSVYNIVDNLPTTWREFVEAVAHAGKAPTPPLVPGALLRVVAPYAGVVMTGVQLRVSNERATRELSWAPRYPTVADGLRPYRSVAGID